MARESGNSVLVARYDNNDDVDESGLRAGQKSGKKLNHFSRHNLMKVHVITFEYEVIIFLKQLVITICHNEENFHNNNQRSNSFLCESKLFEFHQNSGNNNKKVIQLFTIIYLSIYLSIYLYIYIYIIFFLI